MDAFAVGDEVVVFFIGHTMQHNSGEYPQHPCRGKVLKVGRKHYKVSTRGAPLTVPIDGSGPLTIETVTKAKEIKREAMMPGGKLRPNEFRTIEFIEQCIADL